MKFLNVVPRLFVPHLVPLLLLSLASVTRIPVAQAEPVNATASQLIRDGWAARNMEKYGEAEAIFRKAVQAEPRSTSALTGLASVLHDKGQLDDAIALYRKAVELDPNNRSLRRFLETAVKQQQELKQLDQQRAQALKAQVQSMSANSQVLTQQTDSLRKVIQSAPNKPWSYKAYVDLGNTLLWHNQLDDRITSSVRELKRLDPTYQFPGPTFNAALEEKRHSEAIVAYQKATQLKPDVADAYYGLGNVLYEQNEFDAAIANFRKASQLDPRDIFAQHKLEKAQRRLAQRK